MNHKTLKNYFTGAAVCGIFSFAGALIIASLSGRGMQDPLFLYLAIGIFILLGPIWLAVPAYFTFTGIYTVKNIPFAKTINTAMCTFFFLLCIFFFLSLFFAEDSLYRYYKSVYQSVRSQYTQQIAVRQNTDAIRLTIQTNLRLSPPEAAPHIARLQELSAEFPFDPTYDLLIDSLKILTSENISGDSVDIPQPPGTNAAGKNTGNAHAAHTHTGRSLEKKAIELWNARDYYGAGLIYQKLLKIYPDTREYAQKRSGFTESYEKCLQFQRDPYSQISDEKGARNALNIQLDEINSLHRKGDVYGAFFRMKDLRIRYPDNTAVKTLFHEYQTTLAADEFLLPELRVFLKYSSNYVVYPDFSINLNMYVLTAEQIIIQEGFVYLTGIVLTSKNGEPTARYRYGSIQQDTLYVKNKPFEISRQIKDAALKNIARNIHYLSPQNRIHIYLAGPPALLRIYDSAIEADHGIKTLLDFLIAYKFSIPVFVLAFFFILLKISWHNREYITDILMLFFVPVTAVIILLIPLIISYYAVLLQIITHGKTGSLLITLCTACFLLLYAIFGISRIQVSET